jgi:hypothetical protein
MLRRYFVFIVMAVSVISAGALAQNVSVPAYSIVPLTMTSQLSSAVSNVGDRFTATSTGVQGCGFPAGTVFSGRVLRVTRASSRQPGLIAVGFDSATLPDGTCIKIKGALADAAQTVSCQQANNQCLVATHDSRGTHNAFIAGDNCTIFIGVLCRGNVIIGDAINIASICPPTGTIKAAAGQDVVVPCGTKLGVMLESAVCLPAASCPQTARQPACPTTPSGAGPANTATILFSATQPFVANCALMVPLKLVMESTGVQYSLDPKTDIITFTGSQGPITHKLGSNVVTVNGQDRQINGYSGVIGNVVYVPSDVIVAATGMCVKWDADKCMLRIQTQSSSTGS